VGIAAYTFHAFFPVEIKHQYRSDSQDRVKLVSCNTATGLTIHAVAASSKNVTPVLETGESGVYYECGFDYAKEDDEDDDDDPFEDNDQAMDEVDAFFDAGLTEENKQVAVCARVLPPVNVIVSQHFTGSIAQM